MSKLYPKSKVEIEGFLARHYGTLLNLATLGKYRGFIKRAVEEMAIEPDDAVVDLGAGPGYNVQFMLEHLGPGGRVLGLDIGDEVISIFRKRFDGLKNVEIEKRRVDQPLPYEDSFDKALVSFVIHGLPHPAREKLLDNAKKILKEEGRLFILDYGEFDPADLPLHLRLPFKALECKYAFDYVERDWGEILTKKGFKVSDRHSYFGEFAQLLIAEN